MLKTFIYWQVCIELNAVLCRVLNGDISSLFDPQNPDKYTKRLLRFALTRNKSRIEVTEVPISRHSLDSNDVFIFDEGTKMTQWNGRRCDEEERLAVIFYP